MLYRLLIIFGEFSRWFDLSGDYLFSLSHGFSLSFLVVSS